MTTIENDPNRAGQYAGQPEPYGAFGRYRVAPIHTRFNRVGWFVWDAERPDDSGKPTIIREEWTREAAIAGLDTEEGDA